MSPEQDFVCQHCGQRHPGPSTGFALPDPDRWSAGLSDDPLNVLEPETCVVKDRGPHPIATLPLDLRLNTRPAGRRAAIGREPSDHPLAAEPRTGITVARLQEIAETVMLPA